MTIFEGRETKEGFKTSWIHNLIKPKVSGNTINGLGETRERRPTPVYHRMQRHPWLLPQLYFYFRQGWDMGQMIPLFNCEKLKRKQPGYGKDVSPNREGDTPENWSRRVKQELLAHKYGDVVGITELTPELYFDWEYKEDMPIPKYAIMIARPMDYDYLSDNAKQQEWHKLPVWKRKFLRSGHTIMRTYEDGFVAALDLAKWIREKGYPAEALGGPMGSRINLLQAAVEAGIGELGKHGSLINDEYGSSVRLSCVLTDMPLVTDGPRDFGADDFCASCQLCTRECPPGAISENKQLVRGVEKWYVDFDKCVPYFNDTAGCAICLSVCPWSRPGIAANLAVKMMKKKERNTREAA